MFQARNGTENRNSTGSTPNTSSIGGALPTPPSSPGVHLQQSCISPLEQSRRHLQSVLSNGSTTFPMIVIPDNGFWLDGTEHDCSYDHRGALILPHAAWHAKFETDDTAKCYRRFFVNRVSHRINQPLSISFFSRK